MRCYRNCTYQCKINNFDYFASETIILREEWQLPGCNRYYGKLFYQLLFLLGDNSKFSLLFWWFCSEWPWLFTASCSDVWKFQHPTLEKVPQPDNDTWKSWKHSCFRDPFVMAQGGNLRRRLQNPVYYVLFVMNTQGTHLLDAIVK